MRRIQGRTALVTGAASGIGRAIALRLADEGARLYLLDIDQAGLNDVVAESRRRGVEAVGRNCDVSNPAQISAAVNDLKATYGQLHLLINNAGVAYYGRTRSMSAEHWNRVLATNLHAPLQFIRELLPTLQEQDEAHIVNVASICGLVGFGRVAAYCTSKFALVGLTESLRAEFGRQGLGVTALCPGLVDTRLFSDGLHGADCPQPKLPPRWLLTTPERIANCAIKAIYRDRGVVVIQPSAKLIYLVKRFTPWLLDLAGRVRRRKPAAKPQTPPVDQRSRKAAA